MPNTESLPPTADLLTAKQIAAHFGVHAETVRRWARRTENPLPPALVMPGNRKLYRVADVASFVAAEAAQAVA